MRTFTRGSKLSPVCSARTISARWLIDHQALLFYLPPYSPELNKFEIVWRHLKHRWRGSSPEPKKLSMPNSLICWLGTASNIRSIFR
ncbi:transposase [Burkholderia ambifaria]|uniref:transposase n=1 Tax=Burkholderia ambifaria TaxID=152480 RepID=UPI003C7B6637